jgi:3-oxoacyl-[acyl-carrier-protein] synthase III
MAAVYVQSLGTHLPAGRMTGLEAVELGLYEQEQLEDGGINSVPVAGPAASVEMAVLAAREAFARAGIDPRDIDELIHGALFYQGPESWSPLGYILRETGCPDAPAFEVHQGCNSLLAALELAVGRLAAAPGTDRVLLTTAMNADSPVIDRWSSGGPGIVFGDGAAALVVGREPGWARLDSISSLTVSDLEGIHRGTEPLLEPAARIKLDPVARVRGFASWASFPLTEIHGRMAKAYTAVIQRSLAEAELEPERIAQVLCNHLPQHFVESLIMEPLGLPLSRSSSEFGRTVGHLGSCDQVVALDDLLARPGAIEPGDRLLLCGGAPGYNVAAAVITVLELPVWAAAGAPAAA